MWPEQSFELSQWSSKQRQKYHTANNDCQYDPVTSADLQAVPEATSTAGFCYATTQKTTHTWLLGYSESIRPIIQVAQAFGQVGLDGDAV